MTSSLSSLRRRARGALKAPRLAVSSKLVDSGIASKSLSWLDPTKGGALVKPPKQGKSKAIQQGQKVKDKATGEVALVVRVVGDTLVVQAKPQGQGDDGIREWKESQVEATGWGSQEPDLIESLLRQFLRTKGYQMKGEGTCEPGQRADLTGCSPATSEGMTESDSPKEVREESESEEADVSHIARRLSENQSDFRMKLADDERFSLEVYSSVQQSESGFHFEPFNKHIRKCPDGSCLKGKEKKIFDSMQKAFKKAGDLKEPVTVYRGMNLTNKDGKAFLKQIESSVGKEITFPGFTSTTLDEKIADGYGGDVSFKIKAKRGIFVDEFQKKSDPDSQQVEFLQKNGTRYKVVEVEQGVNKQVESLLALHTEKGAPEYVIDQLKSSLKKTVVVLEEV